MWFVKKKESEKKKKIYHIKEESPIVFEEETEHSVFNKNSDLNGGLTLESRDEEEVITTSIDKIEKLPLLKRAVIWSEILDKPVTMR